MNTLKKGQKITFTNELGIFTRKIQSVYVCSFNNEMIKYNTRGLNGGFGCDGFGVEPYQIIKVH